MTTNAHIEKKKLDTPPATIKFKIQRREKEGAAAHWETFELQYRRNLNVISALMGSRSSSSRSRNFLWSEILRLIAASSSKI